MYHGIIIYEIRRRRTASLIEGLSAWHGSWQSAPRCGPGLACAVPSRAEPPRICIRMSGLRSSCRSCAVQATAAVFRRRLSSAAGDSAAGAAAQGHKPPEVRDAAAALKYCQQLTTSVPRHPPARRLLLRAPLCLTSPRIASGRSKYELGQSLCGMMLPKKLQVAHTVLRAVNIETARVADQVSGELQGRMRLMWWKEAVEAATRGRGGPAALPSSFHSPVVLALAALAKHSPALDPGLLDRLIDARIAELDPSQPQEVYGLEKYAEDTQSTLLYALLQCAGYDQAIDPDVPVSAHPN